jgi:hypothetical protein
MVSVASPSQARDTATNEVSVAQLAAGTRLHVPRDLHQMSAPRPIKEASPAMLRKMAEAAATAHTLPVNYFLRLIRQESGFDPNSVSRAGAQGIAQFMPGTASDRGLKDPFDPAEALPKSAELLSEFKNRFGNLGLAAAAYNAGPERIRKWLAGQSRLPQETIDYVYVVTGHDAADWAKSNELTIDLGANGPGPRRRVIVARLAWEAQLLAALQAASVAHDKPSATTTAVKVLTTTSGQAEASLCPKCILQTAY